ncbi:MAG: hypothetical protein WCI18_01885 [Pseudomonadota bacterium]
MDQNQALRRDLELYAKELTKDKFQALSPGLGLGTIRNRPIESSEFVALKQIPVSPKFADKSESYSALNLPAQNAIRRELHYRTPWWALVLSHMADLFIAAIFVVACSIGYKVMNPHMPGVSGLNLGPLRVLSFLYVAFILYLGIFKLLGLTMLGGLVRHRFYEDFMEKTKTEY